MLNRCKNNRNAVLICTLIPLLSMSLLVVYVHCYSSDTLSTSMIIQNTYILFHQFKINLFIFTLTILITLKLMQILSRSSYYISLIFVQLFHNINLHGLSPMIHVPPDWRAGSLCNRKPLWLSSALRAFETFVNQQKYSNQISLNDLPIITWLITLWWLVRHN